MKHIVIDARFLRTSTGRYIERLLHYLQAVDHEHKYTVLLSPQDYDSWRPTNKYFKKIKSPYKEFTFSEQLGLLKQIYGLKPDLVHFGMTQQPILYRGKVVTTIHDLITVRFNNPSKNKIVFWFKQKVYGFVIKVVAKKSKAIITPTEFVKEDVAKFSKINSRKITATLEGADKIDDKPEPIEKLEGKPFIMYVGRPNPHKNLERLIEAFLKLRDNHPELRLVLVGKKDQLYWKIEKQVKTSQHKNIIFTGFASEGQLRWLYENTLVYVFPSLSEGFGLPGLEAMQHGAPVASSNASCLPEVYKDAAQYFDPKNVDEMSETIQKLIEDEKLRKNLEVRGKKLVNQYSWERMAKQTLEVYKEVLGEK